MPDTLPLSTAANQSKALFAEAIEPLLVDINGLSKLLKRSVASLHRDNAAGRLPSGLKIGASKRWRHAEIVAWVAAGCPSRHTWEAIQAADKGGVRHSVAARLRS